MDKEQLLEEIMAQYTEVLFRIAYYYTKDVQVSEDIVQETFVKFYYATNYEERNELKAYLAKMTTNLCKDYLKSWAYKKNYFTTKVTIFYKFTTCRYIRGIISNRRGHFRITVKTARGNCVFLS